MGGNDHRNDQNMDYRYVFPSLLLDCTHHSMWWSVNISPLMFTRAEIFWSVLLEQTRQVHTISLRLPPHYSQVPRECYNPPKREALKQRPGKTEILLGEIKTLSSCDHHRKRTPSPPLQHMAHKIGQLKLSFSGFIILEHIHDFVIRDD